MDTFNLGEGGGGGWGVGLLGLTFLIRQDTEALLLSMAIPSLPPSLGYNYTIWSNSKNGEVGLWNFQRRNFLDVFLRQIAQNMTDITTTRWEAT